MSLSIRRLIASIGRATLESQAMQVLRKYGASMWLFDPDNTYVESDGTGFTTEGSPIGFAQNLNPDLASVVDVQMPELISNGNFVEGGRGWTWQTGVTVGENRLDFATTGSLVSAQQTAAITNGKLYEITFTVTSRSAGAVRVNCGRQGGTTGTFRNTTGTFTELLVAAGEFPDIVVQTDTGGFTGSVTGISVHEVLLGPELVANGDFSSDANWGVPSGWVISGGVASKTVANHNGLGIAGEFKAGKTYRVAFDIVSVTAAGDGISARIGPGTAGSVISPNFRASVGTHYEILTPSTNQNIFQIVPRGATGSWSGSIDNISVREVLTPTVRLGPELIPNGGFNDSTGWNLAGGATISSGLMSIASAAGEYIGASRTSVTEIGKRYLVEADVVINSGTSGIGVASGGNQVVRSTTGRMSGILVSTGTAIEIKRAAAGQAVNGTIDNISVREILPPTRYGPELIVNGNFSNGTNSWQSGLSGSTLSVDASNQAVITFAATAGSRIDQLAPVTPGKTYEASVDCVSTSSGVSLNVILGQSPWSGVMNAPLVVGRNTLRFIAPPQGVFIQINKLSATAGGETCTVDNISLREVIDIPLTQPTSAAKPILRRVPVKFGPELVVNGDFSNNYASWQDNTQTGVGGSTSVSSGVLRLTRTTAFTSAGQPVTLTAGKRYRFEFDSRVVSGTGAPYSVFRIGNNGSGIGESPQTFPQSATWQKNSIVFTPSQTRELWVQVGVTNSEAIIEVDNISLREITDWAWAADFDGVNDFLITNTRPAAAEETLIVAGRFANSVAMSQAMIAKRGGNFGTMVRREDSLLTMGYAMTGTGVASVTLEVAQASTEPSVFAISAKSGESRFRRNGAVRGLLASPYTAHVGSLSVGAETANSFATANIFGAIYAPLGIPDDELRILERYLALRCKQEIL